MSEGLLPERLRPSWTADLPPVPTAPASTVATTTTTTTATVAAAAAAAATTVAAASAAAITARGALLGLTHGHRATLHVAAVQQADGLRGLGIGVHLNESKTAGPARVPIQDHADRRDLTC